MKTKTTQFNWSKASQWFFLLLTFVLVTGSGYSQVAINSDNSTPDASAMLDVKATGLGMLVPRMNLANRPLSPATGLLIYQTYSNPGYYYYDGATWQKVGRSTDMQWATNGSIIYNTNSGNIYSGTITADGHRLNVMNYTSARSSVHGIEHSSYLYSEGMLGLLNWYANPLNLPVDVANVGVFGHIPGNGANGSAIYGWNKDDNPINYGGIFVSDGQNFNSNYAIYADADSASTNFAGYFKGRVHIE